MSGDGHPSTEGDRSSLASELLDGLEAGRHYSTLAYNEDQEPVEVVWNYDREAGQPWQRDDFSDRDESERRRELAIRHQKQYVADGHEATEQTTLITDGGECTGDTDRSADELLAVDYITADELRMLHPTARPLPADHEIEDAECHNCGEPWNDGEDWYERHLHGGPSAGEDWRYRCPNCGFETFEVGT